MSNPPRPIVRVGLSMMAEPDFVSATRELFDGGEVDALEWTPEIGWTADAPLEEVRMRLESFASRGLLFGHGFSCSAFSGGWSDEHELWCRLFQGDVWSRRYRHMTEHLGFMIAGDFVHSSPMPLPWTRRSVALGRERVERLRDMVGMEVGLENLTIALCRSDVLDQGEFLAELIEPVDGFVLLDIHNLYCQTHNFGLEPVDLLRRYPLDRVRELHVAGGSLNYPKSDPEGRPFRRDTHDHAVPEAVFDFVSLALSMCPNVEAVFLERLGASIGTEEEALGVRADFRRLRAMVADATREEGRADA